MRWRPVAGIMLRQVYLMRSSPARILPLFAWVAIDIVTWGFIARYLNKVSGAGLDFVGQLVGAVLLWDFFIRVMQGVTVAFFEDVWSRNFLNLFAAPLSIKEYITGLVLTSMTTSTLAIGVMTLIASGVFHLSFVVPTAFAALYLLVLFLFGTSLGILACALVLRMGPASEWLIWPIPAVISPFAGVFYPLDTLPTWMQWIGRALPVSYVFEGLRSLLAGRPASLQTALFAVALVILQVVVSTWVFTRVHAYAVRHGLLARYSAEAVG
jgi:ABC-2 type transport system permease protein